MAFQKVSSFVANKALGIDVNERHSHEPRDLRQRAQKTLDPAGIYLEDEPTVWEVLREIKPTKVGAVTYVRNLFPSASWLRRYCCSWLLGDVIAGITVGLVVVPQGIAYATLADLPPAYGLYTSFTGTALYWIFGTSKDVVIGATAVGSLLVGQTVNMVNSSMPSNSFSNQEIAQTLTLMAGAIMAFFGLLRLGWVIEFVPYVPISAFVTGASVTIISTQIPTALGISDVNTRDAPYKVFIETLQSLPKARLDAAIGMTSMALLFAIRELCSRMTSRNPKQKRFWAYVNSLRLTFVMLLFILISFLVNHGLPEEEAKFRIVGTIERGFQGAQVPRPTPELMGKVMKQIPTVLIILVVEQIAIAKDMGRVYNYKVNASQEIVALGVANIFGPFLGGYVCTGSFGASAVLSKAGARTPLAGLFGALALILALYALTAMFYYIPKAALAGLIIHAVCNLITPPRSLYKYWQLSPFELCIWFAGFAGAIFGSLELCIYLGIGLSIALVLVRMAWTRGRFLGHVHPQRVAKRDGAHLSRSSSHTTLQVTADTDHSLYLPLDHRDASNPQLSIEAPYPGVFIYRFSEGLNYMNQARHMNFLEDYIKESTNRASEEHYSKESDRPWCEPGPENTNPNLPYLRGIILDFAAVNHVDITCVQGLVDLRGTLDRHAAPDAVEWHFAHIHNRWTRRALACAGFGYPTSKNAMALKNWTPIYSIARVNSGTCSDLAETRHSSDIEEVATRGALGVGTPQSTSTEWTLVHESNEKDESSIAHAGPGRDGSMAAISSVDRPFFHLDLNDAVDAAVRGAQTRDGGDAGMA